jgi:hypothetical protein
MHPLSWRYLRCFTSAQQRQGHCYVMAVDGVMFRTGYVNSTVRTFAMLFSVARPRRMPLDLYIISLFMWDFLQFREEVIGLCELSSLGNKTCTNQGPGSGLLFTIILQRFANLWERYRLDSETEVIRSKWKLSLSLGEWGWGDLWDKMQCLVTRKSKLYYNISLLNWSFLQKTFSLVSFSFRIPFHLPLLGAIMSWRWTVNVYEGEYIRGALLKWTTQSIQTFRNWDNFLSGEALLLLKTTLHEARENQLTTPHHELCMAHLSCLWSNIVSIEKVTGTPLLSL